MENQGICELPENIQEESDKDLFIYKERNQRMLNLFLRKTHGISAPYNWLDYGSGSAHVSRLFKEILKENCNIYCCELNQIYEEFYRFNNLIHLNSLEKGNIKFISSGIGDREANKILVLINDEIFQIKI